MIQCPKCSTRTGVVDSRHRKSGHTTRRRECPRCGYRFTTREVVAPWAHPGTFNWRTFAREHKANL